MNGYPTPSFYLIKIYCLGIVGPFEVSIGVNLLLAIETSAAKQTFLVNTPNMPSAETIHLLVVGLVLLGVFLAFLKDWASPDIIAMTGFAVVVITGILGTEDILKVFSNSAPMTIGSMFVLSAALEKTGVIDQMGQVFIRLAGQSEIRALIVLMVMAASLSAFVNNTPVVVVFLPLVIGLARTTGLKASRLLIPLSFAGMLGGTCTLIGSSTNLLIDGMAQQFGLKAFGLFEISKLGILYAIAGLLYLLLIGRHLLPKRETLASILDVNNSREYLLEAVIGENSVLIGKTVPQSPFAKMKEARIIEVRRKGMPQMQALDELHFQEGDQLLLKVHSSQIQNLKEMRGIVFPARENQQLGLVDLELREARLLEGVIGPYSSMIGKTIAEMNFRQRYGAIILAVHRQGQNLQNKFENLRLAFGDTLLVEGPIEGISRLREEKDFVSLTEPKQRTYHRRRAPIAILVILAVVLLAAFQVMPISTLALLGAVAVVLFGCVSPDKAYEAIDWKILFLIFGMLAIGFAVEETGGARLVALAVLEVIGDFHPIVVLSIVYLMTVLITEMISNNATAILLTPLVVQMAHQMELDARPLIIAVMFGASACFATPIGYQTNTYIYGAGGYKFSDFPKVGLLLNVLLWLVATMAIPWLFPFK